MNMKKTLTILLATLFTANISSTKVAEYNQELATSIVADANIEAMNRVHENLDTQGTVTYDLITEIDDRLVGYIRISMFAQNTYDEFVTVLDSLKEYNVDGVILNLRNNPGGLLNIATDIANLIVADGSIVNIQYMNGDARTVYSDSYQKLDVPLVVLVNRNSASSSEVLTGAIQDHKVGVVVGEQTFGKGEIEAITPQSNGSFLRETIAIYYTPSGRSIEGVGIIPDYLVEMTASQSANIHTAPRHADVQMTQAVTVLSQLLSM